METDISKAAAALGRKGGAAKSKAKSEAAKANGAKGGRPGLYTVEATEKGYEVGPTIFLAVHVSRQTAIERAKSAAAEGYEGVFVSYFRASQGMTIYLNPDGSCANTGKAWDKK